MKTIFLALIILMFFGSGLAYAANEYTNSAHGDTTNGVNSDSRGDPDTSAYTTGNCAHCHLYQHQSLNGAASGTALSPQDRADIIPFCLECHYIVQGGSAAITWNSDTTADDIHGNRNITNAGSLKDLGGINVGDITEVDGNYTISCIVCHEPHGTSNVVLIRNEINGAALAGTITTIVSPDSPYGAPDGSTRNTEFIYICNRCHTAGTKTELCAIHHTTDNPPYSLKSCTSCHYSRSGGSTCSATVTQISCTNCHFHGSDDSWAGGNQTGRRPF